MVEDARAQRVIAARLSETLLRVVVTQRLGRCPEAGTDHDAGGAEHERRRESAAIGNAARRRDRDRRDASTTAGMRLMSARADLP